MSDSHHPYDVNYARESFVKLRRAIKTCNTPDLLKRTLEHYTYELNLIEKISPNEGFRQLMELATTKREQLLAAIAAFGRVAEAIQIAADEDACRRIFDELLDEWGARYEPDVEAVRKVNPAAVDDLKGRLFTRIRTFRETSAK